MTKDEAREVLPGWGDLHEMIQEAMEEAFGDPDAFTDEMAKNVLDKIIDWMASDA